MMEMKEMRAIRKVHQGTGPRKASILSFEIGVSRWFQVRYPGSTPVGVGQEGGKRTLGPPSCIARLARHHPSMEDSYIDPEHILKSPLIGNSSGPLVDSSSRTIWTSWLDYRTLSRIFKIDPNRMVQVGSVSFHT